ncbi:MAG: helix-turn-helix transcriptional regulator [Cyanobacteria bacterium P01_A01_bin.135]
MTDFIPVYPSETVSTVNPTYSPQVKEPVSLMQSIIEGLPDGVLILTRDGGIISSNSLARAICRQLSSSTDPVNNVPPAIWVICAPLLEGDRLMSVSVQCEGTLNAAAPVRVRARWLQPDAPDRILVMLEDQYQAAQQRALVEGARFGFTTREAEVFLYRCINYTYDDIARKLHITINTVKKHIKSINMKRESHLDDLSA